METAKSKPSQAKPSARLQTEAQPLQLALAKRGDPVNRLWPAFVFLAEAQNPVAQEPSEEPKPGGSVKVGSEIHDPGSAGRTVAQS